MLRQVDYCRSVIYGCSHPQPMRDDVYMEGLSLFSTSLNVRCKTGTIQVHYTRVGYDIGFQNTRRCRYNGVNFLENFHKRHSIARPLGRLMGCLLWVQTLIHILSLSWCMQYHNTLYRVITAYDSALPQHSYVGNHQLRYILHWLRCQSYLASNASATMHDFTVWHGAVVCSLLYEYRHSLSA